MTIDPMEAARRLTDREQSPYAPLAHDPRAIVQALIKDAVTVARALLAGPSPPPVREALENLRQRCQMILPSDSDESKLARLVERDISAALSEQEA